MSSKRAIGKDRSKQLKFEALEDRLVLDAGPLVISEFMALNETGLTDSFGQTEDWLEIRNRGTESVDLEGWFLTDDATDLTGWQFPATTIEGGDSLIVFASGNDLTDPAGELHTNFGLRGKGEYLALVRPDGVTIESEFAPEFPTQYDDISYGWSSDFSEVGYFTNPSPGNPNLDEPIADPTNQVVFNEIMYHPKSEDSLEEYVELYNRGFLPVNLKDWRISSGVQFTFPDHDLNPGEYLVVAADIETFKALYPDVDESIVIGGWEGKLADGGEELELVDATGDRIDRVSYADQGDWGVRERGIYDQGYYGWAWAITHDGGGKSLELINPMLSNNYGHNWAASTPDGGTPGEVNSVDSDNIAPMITDIGHYPVIPHHDDPVTVTARLRDESAVGVTATVYYRNSVLNTLGPFSEAEMFDDGQHGDGAAGDGVYGAILPAAANRTVVEFYVHAEDSTGTTRDMPIPVEQTDKHVANLLLYQVIDTFDAEAAWDPDSQPAYHIIMTPTESAMLTSIYQAGGLFGTDAQMNATFISVDGTGVRYRYNAGVRNRGHGSRSGPPGNYRVNFANDKPWRGVTAININKQSTHLQTIGSAIHRLAGNVAPNATAVKMWVNGSPITNISHGSYVHVEAPDGDFTDAHFPGDGQGDLYKVMRQSRDFTNEDSKLAYPPDGANHDYRRAYNRMTNEVENDYSRLIQMLQLLNAPASDHYFADVSEVINVEQWMRFLALNSLFDNTESGLFTGVADDFMMYQGFEDPRFVLIPHDMDTIIEGRSATKAIFGNYKGVTGLARLFADPTVEQMYYQAFIDLIDTVWNPETLNPLIDRVLDHVSVSTRTSMKNFVVARTNSVMSQLAQRGFTPVQQEFSITSELPTVDDYYHTLASGAALSGTSGPGAGSVTVNGAIAEFDPTTGQWSIPEGDAGMLVTPGAPTVYRVPAEGDDPLAWTAKPFDDTSWTGTRQLYITEANSSAPDWIEIQNFSETDLVTDGWVLAVNRGTTGDVNAVQTLAHALPSVISGGEVLYRSDSPAEGDNYFGENIFWGSLGPGWAMIVDDQGAPVDFVVWGYTGDQLAELDVTINGGRIRGTDVWFGDPVPAPADTATSLQRKGNSDTDSAADFAFLQGPSMGVQNPLLQLPFEEDRQGPGTTGFGFGDDLPSYAIHTDMESEMRGTNASLWTRIPFESPDPTVCDALQLRMKYNDGFVAYLNGHEIARSNAPETLAWNSTATAERTAEESALYEVFDVSDAIEFLVEGENILAIHGLNVDAADDNFLIVPELSGSFYAAERLSLNPGANRVLVQVFDGENGTGEQLRSGSVDIWSGPIGSAQTIPEGSLAGELYSTDGPYLVGGDVTVEAGTTLTIQPGTTLLFAPGASLTVYGRLLAEGTEHDTIRFTRVPGSSGSWSGIQLVNSMEDNRISYAVVEYASTLDGMVGLENSNLTIDHATFDHTSQWRIRSTNSSLIVENSTFGEMFPGDTAPTTSGQSEHIRGEGIPAGGHLVIKDNVFGAVKGANNAIDFDAGLGAPIIQILGNTFDGSGDDAVKVDGDARIEGNVFTHVHNDAYNAFPGEVAAISAGNGDELFVSGNVFYDVGHAVLVRDGAMMTFMNNTVMEASEAAIYFDAQGKANTPGQGAYLDGVIFIDTPTVFGEVVPTTDLTVNRSILPSQYHSLGTGNWEEQVSLTDPENGDFSLSPGSAHLNIGATAPADLWITGEPSGTAATDVTLTVATPGGSQRPFFTHYKYRVNDGPWSDERPVDEPIELTGLANGDYTVYVIGKNTVGLWQDPTEATASRTWTVDPTLERVRINEVLASNVSTFENEGVFPDMIELLNDGGVPVDLGGMGISDKPDDPTKFIFPDGTIINPGEYMLLFADDETGTPGLHLGFKLSSDGEGVYLFDTPTTTPTLVDSVEFGVQIPDLSIGRVGFEGEWMLTQPTFGGLNIASSLGDSSTLKINEWLVDAQVRSDEDFLELYNPDPLPVSLGGLYLTDDPVMELDKHRIPPLSFIAGEGYAVFVPDGDETSGGNHLGFKLNNFQELIGLSDAKLQNIDKVIYYPQTTDISEGRAPDGDVDYDFFDPPTPGGTNIALPGVADLLEGLRVTELMYHPADDADREFIELMNVSDKAVDLTGVRLDGAVSFTFPELTLPAGERVVVVRDLGAFYSHYGTGMRVAGEYSGNLSDDKETLVVELPAPLDTWIQQFRYNDNWYPTTDGGGFALTIIDPTVDAALWDEAASWQAGTVEGGSPGRDDTEAPQTWVVISEVLTHTDPPLSDAIELHNTSDFAIDVGGWFLSDSADMRRKFRIPTDDPAATTIQPGGYLVFDEGDFNPTPESPEANHFALDGAHGDDVWLTIDDAEGNATITADYVVFGGAANGESFGRRFDDSGRLHFTPNQQRTMPGENSAPRVGPVVISEIHYNPGIMFGADDLEFIELHNTTDDEVSLENWRLRGGVDLDFAPDATIAAQSTLLVLPFDPADPVNAARRTLFVSTYGLDPTAPMVGGYGTLNNGGESIRLQRPDEPPLDEPTYIPRLLEDEVRYDDVAPWPTEADGGGSSLQRIGEDSWGQNAASWEVAAPTPGSVDAGGQADVQAGVLGRYIFYNNSAFDGANSAADSQDDAAIAMDKHALREDQTATFANYTTYDKGINGIIVDIAGLGDAAALDATADFEFKVGNGDDTGTWTAAPVPERIAVRAGEGVAGSDRVTIRFADGSIVGRWLQVTVLDTAATGLDSPDIFYFGNAVGEAGDQTANAIVNATDEIAPRNSAHGVLNPAGITDPYDYNRDRLVDATDQLIARNHATNPRTMLRLITPTVADAVIAEQIEQQAPDAMPSAADLDWIYEYEQMKAKNRSTEKATVVDTAIEQLLADQA